MSLPYPSRRFLGRCFARNCAAHFQICGTLVGRCFEMAQDRERDQLVAIASAIPRTPIDVRR
jgi:hypothetical protein